MRVNIMTDIEIIRHINHLIDCSKERPQMYSQTPDELEIMWHWLEVVTDITIGKRFRKLNMSNFGSQYSDHELGARRYCNYLREELNITEPEDIYNKLIEYRVEYEKWLKDKIEINEPTLMKYFEK